MMNGKNYMAINRQFDIKHSPFEFFGKTKYFYDTVFASSCENALGKFRTLRPKNILIEIVGVKSSNSLRWKTDPSLTRNIPRSVNGSSRSNSGSQEEIRD